MKKFLCIALLACAAADAQAPAPPPVVADAGSAAPSAPAAPVVVEEKDPTSEDVLKAVGKVGDDYKAGGALAGIAALLALIMQLSKAPFLRKLLDDRGLGYVRPIAILVLSAVGGVIATLQAGAKPGPALLMGALAGVTGVGMREVLKLISPDQRSRVNVDVDAVATASAHMRERLENQAEARSDTALADVKKKLGDLDKLSEREKLEKLAEMMSQPAKPALVAEEKKS